MGSGRIKNEKDCGVMSLEQVGEIKTRDFVNRDSENKKRPKETYRYSEQARSKIRPRAKS